MINASGEVLSAISTMLLLPVNEVGWVLEMAIFDFSGDNFLNLNLPPNFDHCPDGSCEICCTCIKVEKRSNKEFGTKGEHIENSDVVENYIEWDFSLVYDHYEGDEDVIEDFHGQLYNGVQALIIRSIHDPFWDNFVTQDMRGELFDRITFQHNLNYLDSFEEVIWKHYSKVIIFKKKGLMLLWNILVGHPKDGGKKKVN
ncbi:hypothetical protein D8674_030437 [Pyrus ussuriensis x Pyrus communis]|uniref:Uncharacterized protein n=1 Tax=Pyrus ussuriensis x Pyrus communis TaxID=2448454 RepID=A0A5N5EW49_9ROSA|nr:hypothetical protein D8674_030437 [Pyrus ussuriensis x Pyrus communis]